MQSTGARPLERSTKRAKSIAATFKLSCSRHLNIVTLRLIVSTSLISPTSRSTWRGKGRKKRTILMKKLESNALRKIRIVSTELPLLTVCQKICRNCRESQWLPDLTSYALQRKRKASKGWLFEAQNPTRRIDFEFGRISSNSSLPRLWAQLGINRV